MHISRYTTSRYPLKSAPTSMIFNGFWRIHAKHGYPLSPSLSSLEWWSGFCCCFFTNHVLEVKCCSTPFVFSWVSLISLVFRFGLTRIFIELVWYHEGVFNEAKHRSYHPPNPISAHPAVRGTPTSTAGVVASIGVDSRVGHCLPVGQKPRILRNLWSVRKGVV